MKKLVILVIIFLCFTGTAIHAQGFNFGWNIGNAKIYYDAINAGFNYDVDLGQFYLINNRFSIGLNAFSFYSTLDKDAHRYLILPLEIAFLPINYNGIFLSVYGKIGWQLTQYTNDNNINHEFYGAIGLKFMIFSEIIYHYSYCFSLFVEYDIHNKLKFGVGIDLAALVVMGLVIFKQDSFDRYGQQNPPANRRLVR